MRSTSGWGCPMPDRDIAPCTTFAGPTLFCSTCDVHKLNHPAANAPQESPIFDSIDAMVEHLDAAESAPMPPVLRVAPPMPPTQQEQNGAISDAVLRLATEVEQMIADAPADDPEVRSLRADIILVRQAGAAFRNTLVIR